ncbi:MarR family transcriptional regulator [Novosphingobium sp.]|uniref:MarR family winged helix-turn-helix transcriptional regulator n=1 Tax=Novosphingobium sp. TaxID=1874826 RepID=UPI001DA1A837|nr:MarR family transcriptional regulator [Novosphingobium sp.]MBX9664288.1 ArsR family transcriptional regulator [Novosphingobium sp.]
MPSDPVDQEPDGDESALPPLAERISFLVHRVGAHMARISNPWFQEAGVDLVTSRMIVLLAERGELTAGEIVKVMALPQSTISHQLKRLEGLGYLTREVGPQDSRIVIARLTPEGIEVARRSNALSREVVDALVAAIGEDDLPIVRAALKRADAALEAMFEARQSSSGPRRKTARLER